MKEKKTYNTPRPGSSWWEDSTAHIYSLIEHEVETFLCPHPNLRTNSPARKSVKGKAPLQFVLSFILFFPSLLSSLRGQRKRKYIHTERSGDSHTCFLFLKACVYCCGHRCGAEGKNCNFFPLPARSNTLHSAGPGEMLHLSLRTQSVLSHIVTHIVELQNVSTHFFNSDPPMYRGAELSKIKNKWFCQWLEDRIHIFGIKTKHSRFYKKQTKKKKHTGHNWVKYW